MFKLIKNTLKVYFSWLEGQALSSSAWQWKQNSDEEQFVY